MLLCFGTRVWCRKWGIATPPTVLRIVLKYAELLESWSASSAFQVVWILPRRCVFLKWDASYLCDRRPWSDWGVALNHFESLWITEWFDDIWCIMLFQCHSLSFEPRLTSTFARNKHANSFCPRRYNGREAPCVRWWDSLPTLQKRAEEKEKREKNKNIAYHYIL